VCRYTAAVYTAREHVFARENGPSRPYNGRAVYTARTRPCMGHAHDPSTPPVYMTVYGPSVRTSSVVYVARTRTVYTPMYGSCTRPCTRHVYDRVHVSTCTRPCTRPCTAIYTAENGRLHGRVTCRVYGRVRAYRLVYTAVYEPCARPFSAV